MKTEENRRKSQPTADDKLYKLSTSSIKNFIKEERRHDELDRLREVNEQTKVWWKTIIFCGALNITLILLAMFGSNF